MTILDLKKKSPKIYTKKNKKAEICFEVFKLIINNKKSLKNITKILLCFRNFNINFSFAIINHINFDLLKYQNISKSYFFKYVFTTYFFLYFVKHIDKTTMLQIQIFKEHIYSFKTLVLLTLELPKVLK